MTRVCSCPCAENRLARKPLSSGQRVMLWRHLVARQLSGRFPSLPTFPGVVVAPDRVAESAAMTELVISKEEAHFALRVSGVEQGESLALQSTKP
jgi:hypothetical protein